MNFHEVEMIEPKPRRRWFRFSIRSLLLLVVLIAIPLALKVNQVHHQRLVVAELRKLKVLVAFDYNRPNPFSHVIDPQGHSHWGTRVAEPFGPKWLRNILGDDFFSEVTDILTPGENLEVTDDTLNLIATLRSPRSINIQSDHISDEGFRHLATLGQLEDLCIVARSITDAGLTHLGKLTQLNSLTLYFDSPHPPTNAGFSHLLKLQNLTWLAVGEVEITDGGLESIARLKKLQYLELNSPLITDAGIMHLKNTPNLREAQLFCDEVTKDGMEKLRKALPNCAVGSLVERYPDE
jgi:hypothetical protein